MGGGGGALAQRSVRRTQRNLPSRRRHDTAALHGGLLWSCLYVWVVARVRSKRSTCWWQAPRLTQEGTIAWGSFGPAGIMPIYKQWFDPTNICRNGPCAFGSREMRTLTGIGPQRQVVIVDSSTYDPQETHVSGGAEVAWRLSTCRQRRCPTTACIHQDTDHDPPIPKGLPQSTI